MREPDTFTMTRIEMRIATQQDWKILPMPDESKKIAFQREYPIPESERLRAGLVPEEMEDK